MPSAHYATSEAVVSLLLSCQQTASPAKANPATNHYEEKHLTMLHSGLLSLGVIGQPLLAFGACFQRDVLGLRSSFVQDAKQLLVSHQLRREMPLFSEANDIQRIGNGLGQETFEYLVRFQIARRDSRH